jgi:hypothetical protein
MRAFTMDENGDSLDYMVFDPDQYGLIYSILMGSDSNTINFHMDRAGGYSNAKRLALDTNLGFISIDSYPSSNFDGPFYTLPYSNNILSGGYYYDSQQAKQFISALMMDQSLNIINEIVLCDGEMETYPAWIKCIDYHYANQIFISGMYDYSGIYYDLPNWIYLARLNENLDLMYDEYWGGDAFYSIFSICAIPDGGVVLAGYVYDHLSYSYQYDGLIIKFDSIFFVGIESPIISDNIGPNIEIRANRENIYIESDINSAELIIYDLSGKCMLISSIESGNNHISVNLGSGIYIWMVRKGEKQFTGKLNIN